MKIKCGCIIQGDIRRGINEALKEMQKHFEVVILSTWAGEETKIPEGLFEIIINEKPENIGFTNRNLQRLSTAAGLKRAEEMGCTHILKWRTDMLPTKLNVNKLLEWSSYNVPNEVSSRVVTCAFRNLTVEQDYFSSIPDLFAFADLEMMKLLWGSEGFDYSKDMNIPKEIIVESGTEWLNDENAVSIFGAETELYANFRIKLEEKTGLRLNHIKILSDYMYLINHERLKICWFGSTRGFRSIITALFCPWWTEKVWRKGNPTINGVGYKVESGKEKFWFKISPILSFIEVQKQKIWFKKYLKKI